MRSDKRVVRRELADGTIKEYRYERSRPKEQRHPLDTLGGLILAYRTSPEWKALKPRTQLQYLHSLRSLEPIHHVKTVDVRRRNLLQIRNLIADSRGPGAAQKFISVAQSLFAWALDYELVEYSPALKIKTLKGGHLPAWTAEQADLAEANLPEHLRRVVVLGRHTGQRRIDLCRMTWGDYDGRKVRLQQIKTGKKLVLPCPITLRAELDAWKGAGVLPASFILTNLNGMPWTPTRMSQALPEALQRIGLPVGLNVHGLRKLAAASLAEAGCSAKEIAAITGHDTLAMIELYTASAEQERLAEAAILRLENAQVKKRENGE